MLHVINATTFAYLGETYEIEATELQLCMKRKLARRLFSRARNTAPNKDTKQYSLLIFSTEDEYNRIAFTSNLRKYTRNLEEHQKVYRHKVFRKLSRPQAQYLKDKLSPLTDFHEAIKIASEKIEIFPAKT